MPRLAGFGTQTFFSLAGVNGPWTKIGDLKSFDDISAKKAEIDVTGLEDSAKQYIGGIQEGQTFTLDMYQNDAAPEQATLRTAWAGDAPIFIRERDPRTTVTQETVFGFTPLDISDGKGQGDNAKMLKLSGRITGNIVVRAKTPV